MDSSTASTKQDAWRAALRIAGYNRDAASRVFDQAEMSVLRRLVVRLLTDGEDGYWRLVAEEIEEIAP